MISISFYYIILLNKKIKTGNFQKGKGCDKCRHSGYYGRTGIFEITGFDDELRAYIIEKRPFSEFKRLTQDKKVKTLKAIAIKKAAQGVTTIEDVIRVTGEL